MRFRSEAWNRCPAAPNHDRMAPNRDRMASDHDRVTPGHDRMASDRDRMASDRDRVTPDHDRVASDRDRVTPDHDRMASGRGLVTSGNGLAGRFGAGRSFFCFSGLCGRGATGWRAEARRGRAGLVIFFVSAR